MLDVGQGDATVIVPPEGEGLPVVFDCRDDYVVHKFLAHWGYLELESVIVSHLDWDHIAGVRQLLEREDLEIRQVYLHVDRDIQDTHPHAVEAKALIDCANAGDRERKWTVFQATVQAHPVSAGKDWSIEIVAPRHRQFTELAREGRWKDPNVLSVVLRVRMGTNTVLIGGDAPLVTWAEIRDRNARVFRIPHHGGALSDGGIPKGWSAERLYQEVGPDVAVVSVGTNNQPKHPSPEWIGPACKRSRIMCTQVTPHCQRDVVENADAYRSDVLRKASLVEADWWHLHDRYGSGGKQQGVPCAGSVVVTLYPGQMRVLPVTQKHELVLGLWDHRLCDRD
ncbi:MAG: MBL fold metallo-hydrolase [Deltaproteobacteria bacterium]|nr:MBL fold metallo-hydrolase [Deltaproteobacteria bacterium]